MLIIHSLFFIIGLVLLVKGSDIFVKSAATIAKKLGVSEFVIGLTVVAVGTSIPELASSIFASLQGVGGLIMGTVVGSNIANIGLIVGIGALIRVVKVKREILVRDGYIMLFAALLFFGFILDRSISRWEAVVFLLLYIAYVFFLIEERRKYRSDYPFKEFLSYFFGFKFIGTADGKVVRGAIGKINGKKTTSKKANLGEMVRKGLLKDIFLLAAGVAAITFGSRSLVDEAVFFSQYFSVPPALIGLSVVAIGTSLPELTVMITLFKKGYSNIALGNIIGSNIANIFLIVGVSSLIAPISIIKPTLLFTAPFMILMSIVLLLFMRSEWKIVRWEAVLLLLLYALFIALSFYIVPTMTQLISG